MSISKSISVSKRDRSIPRRPLLWLAAALLFTLPPMFGSLVRWVPYVFLLALAMKFWMEPRGYRLRFATLKLMLAAAALFAIFASYGFLKGVEPAVSLLVVLMSLKILEAQTAREFQVMVLIGWEICLCGFFLSQDFAFALCLLVALLCLFFPRINSGFRLELRDLRSASTGFSDQLSPGSIATLANSSDIAFRAEFPGGKTPPPGPMYWRGAVMWRCDGMEWRAQYTPASTSRSSSQFPTGNTIRQRILLAPHGARWMFALDRPFESPRGAVLVRGDYLWSTQPIRKPRRYEVVSSPEVAAKELTANERREALDVPSSLSPAVRELAQSWTAHNSTPRAIINSALQFFRTQD